jgi:hypothetical protein
LRKKLKEKNDIKDSEAAAIALKGVTTPGSKGPAITA